MAYNILVQGVCPLKIKITRFPDGFCLNISPVKRKIPLSNEINASG